MLNRSLPCLVPLLLAAVVLACGSRDSGSQFLSIATGGTGGVYYPYGGGLAKILNENLPNVRASAEVTSASVDNLKLIRDGKADIAFVLADTLADAVNGKGAFEGSAVPAASLAVLYANYTHIATLAQSGMTKVKDLRGKTVSIGSPGSGTEVLALRVLRAAGLNPDADLTRQRLGASESAGALKDGKIDAFFWSGGLPTAAVQDLAHSQGVSLRLLPSGDLLPALQREYGALYFPLEIPAGAYRGIVAPVGVVGVANVLVVNRSMPEQLAYDITRVLFEKQPELAAIHPEARKLSLDTAMEGSPAPFHPGATRYFNEKRHVTVHSLIPDGTCVAVANPGLCLRRGYGETSPKRFARRRDGGRTALRWRRRPLAARVGLVASGALNLAVPRAFSRGQAIESA